MKSKFIYHYTHGELLDEILSDGKLRVSEFERINKIKPPALWLSLNPIWENTALKMVDVNGHLRTLTKSELHEKSGLIRFVLEFKKDTLCSWAKYRYKSNTPYEVYENMEKTGIRQGADPKEWYASFVNIPLRKCVALEKWNGKEWIKHVN